MQKLEIYNLQKGSPFRPPNWKWRLAHIVQRYGEPLPVKVTKEIRKLVEFKSLIESESEENWLSDEVYKRYSELLEAYKIYVSNKPLRHILEARILAKEDFNTIASKLGIANIKIIKTYVSVFYDVIDRLNSPDYIVHIVIGLGGLSRIYDFWKFFGYWCGPNILDELIHMYNESEERNGDIWNSDCKKISKIQLALALRGASDISEDRIKQLVQLYTKILAIEQKKEEKKEEETEDKIKEILKSIKFKSWHDEPTEIETDIGEADRSNISLRSSELIEGKLPKEIPDFPNNE